MAYLCGRMHLEGFHGSDFGVSPAFHGTPSHPEDVVCEVDAESKFVGLWLYLKL